MSMEYEVKVKGLADLDRFEKAIQSLDSAMRASKGAAELNKSLQTINSSVKGIGSSLARTLKSELELTRQVFRTELAGIGAGAGKMVSTSIETELGGGIETGIKGATTKAKTAAAKAKAEMTRAYESIIGGDGLKALTKSELDEIATLKRFGAEVSAFHTNLLNTSKTAKESASTFTAAYANELARSKQLMADFNKTLGLDKSYVAKSAKDAAATFTEAYSTELARSKQGISNFEKALGLDKSRIVKSATDSAAVFNEAYALEMQRGKQTFANFDQLMGLDKSRVAKSAKDSAAVFTEAYTLEMQRGRQLFANFDKMLGLDRTSIVKSAKDSAAVFGAAYEAELRRIQGSVRAATNTTSEMYQRYSPSLGTPGRMVNVPEAPTTTVTRGLKFDSIDTGKIVTATNDMARFTKQTGDAHAAARGLASGFDLLWLTWGNLGPLMAGAALSNTFMKSAKEGMEVAHTLEIIRVLGGATRDEVDRLSASMEHLGVTGVFGPKQTAEAMQTLVLAGMKASDVVGQMKNVLDFSVAGTTSIQNAADVLVSVTTAFGTGAGGIQKSSDIIVRAAADSKASVESFGEAMKTASVVGEQFGASQEDVAALISVLANLGIQGTAAGTAIRNMYTDMSGRTPKVSKALKQMGLDFRDSEGKMKPLLQSMSEFDGALKRIEEKDPKKAKDFIATIYSERGGKAAVAALAEYRQKIIEAETSTNSLEQRLASLGMVAGTTGLAAAQLAETTQSAWKRVGATLETSLEKAFKNMEPQLYSTANAMRDLFASPEFVSSVTTIATAVASVGEAIAQNSKMIATGLAVWGAYKLATAAIIPGLVSISGAMATVTGAFSGSAVAMGIATAATTTNTSATAANTAVQAASLSTTGKVLKGIGAVASILPYVGLALTAATVAWDAYAAAKARANGASSLALERTENVIKSLNDETAAMKAKAKALREGQDMSTYDALTSRQNDYEQSVLKTKEQIAAATAKINEEEAKRNKLIKEGGFSNDPRSRSPESDPAISALTESIAAQKGVRAKAESDLGTMTQGYLRAKGEFIAASASLNYDTEKASEKKAKESAEAYKAMLKKYGLKDVPDGPNDFGEDGGGRGGRGGKGPAAHQTFYDTTYETSKRVSEAQKTFLESYYQQGLLSAEQYYDYLDRRAEQSYDEEKKALEKKRKEFSADPRSAKEYEKAGVDLQVLELNRAVELRKLEQDRDKAVASRLTSEGKIAAFGEDYLMRLRENESDKASIKHGSEYARIEQAKAKISEDFYKQRVKLAETFVKETETLEGEGLENRKKKYADEFATIRSYEDQALDLVRMREEEKRQLREKGMYGATRAVENYMTSAADMASQVENLTTTALKNVEDALVTVATTGKISFKSMADAIIADFSRIAARQVTSGVSNLIGQGIGAVFGLLGGGGASAGAGSVLNTTQSFGSLIKSAKGNVFNNAPALSQYSNTVQSTPKMFAFAQGGVFAEAGPEAIMPLTRGADGNLGVRNHGGGGSKFILNVRNYGAEVETTEHEDADGNTVMEMVIRAASDRAVKTVAGQISSGTGQVGKAMRVKDKMGL